MTNSMIPYSFVPGTKAKASEVNANFLSLANIITQNQTTSSSAIQTMQGQIESMSSALTNKADRSELQTIHVVSETNTNLDTYLTPGTYVFDTAHSPTNPPAGNGGLLIVTGTSNTFIKQIWYGDGVNTAVHSRDYSNSTWGNWKSEAGISSLSNPGYLRMPNGLIIQWGNATGNSNTYPIAFPQLACVTITKQGESGSFERSDSGISSQSLTGFTYTSHGVCNNINWIAIGY